MPAAQRTICRPDQHHFVPKHQTTAHEGPRVTVEVSEVFCEKCGTVCFLTQREPGRIALAQAN